MFFVAVLSAVPNNQPILPGIEDGLRFATVVFVAPPEIRVTLPLAKTATIGIR